MRRRYPIAALAAAATLAGTVAVPSSSGQDAPPEALELLMRHREARVELVDVGTKRTRRRPSESPGDLAVSRARLRDATGARAGTVHGAFMVTGGRGERTSEQVTATFVLPDGQITVQGLMDNAREGADVIAVTGGTGRYAGAAGSVRISGDREAVRFAFTLVR